MADGLLAGHAHGLGPCRRHDHTRAFTEGDDADAHGFAAFARPLQTMRSPGCLILRMGS